MIRLDKFLADCKIGTRSEVKKLIKTKKVSVNGMMINKPDSKIDEVNDCITVNGNLVIYEKYGYYIFHKPAGCVTAVKDNLHKTVMDYFDKQTFEGYYPVGRLDIDTEGLLLITNDGDTAHHLISPNHHVSKTYYVELEKPLDAKLKDQFKEGIDIGDEKETLPATLKINKTKKNLETGVEIYSCELTIIEGRFHQVKRMFQAVGNKVLYLKRISMGALFLGDLSIGTYRKLSQEEINMITTNTKGE